MVGSTAKLLLSLLLSSLVTPALLCEINIESRYAYVRKEGNSWILGTSSAERRIRLANGQLSLVSLRNKQSGTNYQGGSSEIGFLANGANIAKLGIAWRPRESWAQGELELDIELESRGLIATKPLCDLSRLIGWFGNGLRLKNHQTRASGSATFAS